MRVWAWLVIPVLAFWLLGAHFYRYGATAAALLCVTLPGLLFFKGFGPVRLLQAVLIAGVGLWLMTAVQLTSLRMAMGQPYVRLVVILGAVVVANLWGAYALQRWGRARQEL